MSTESKVGRPSKYKPEYCEQLISHMSEGLSFESFAGVVKVNRDTLYEWEKTHEEFSDAKKQALELNLLFWEKLGRDHVLNETLDEENHEEGTKRKSSKSLNSTVWIFNMKNRHKWRDKQPDESDVVINNNNNVATLSEDALDAKINNLIEKKK